MTASTEAPATTEAPKSDLPKALIEKARKMRADGLTWLEICAAVSTEKRKVTTPMLTAVLGPMPKPGAKAGGVQVTRERKVVGTIDWDAFVAGIPKVKGAVIGWRRAEYVMLRADAGVSGVQSLIEGTKSKWVTICHHGTMQTAEKGSTAENHGRERATWCEKCAKGEPGKTAKRDLPEGTKADGTAKAAPAVKVDDAKPVKVDDLVKPKAAPKAAPKAKAPAKNRAVRNAEAAAAKKAAAEAAAAAPAEDSQEVPAGDDLEAIA